MSRVAESRAIENPHDWVIRGLIEKQARKDPNRIAIEFVDATTWTYKDCIDQALSSAACLQSAGVSQGDCVAVMVSDPVDFCRQWLGLTFNGITMVAINTSMQGASLAHQLAIASVTTVIVDIQHAHVVDLIDTTANILHTEQLKTETKTETGTERQALELPDISHRDRACIMFTSGTSGPSKGVEMPQAHCVMFAIGTIENYQLQNTDVFYICLPLFHANGLFMQLLACLINGTRAVVRGKFSASQWLSDIKTHGATHTNMLGAVAAFVVAQPPSRHDKNHQLRVIGAAPLTSAAEEVFRDRFAVEHVIPLYGMTEVNIPLYGNLGQSAPGTCGVLYDRYFEVEIRDTETDDPLPDNTIGEIMVRPKQPYGFMSGYVGMPEKTVEAWRNFWFHTGDAGYRNQDGQFVFVDRIKDCIRRRGENISSYEVEQAFLAIDSVAEAAAYAVPAGEAGMEDEVMLALMVKDISNAKLADWLETASANLPTFAAPRYIRLLLDLPKTPTGKVRKVVLREEGITDDTIDMKLKNLK